ncbi:cbb3-type cytochrome oxidase assembly protein CcoS [Methylobacterium sp. 092160098-2]|nr:cbb3-type cytochrome oxidase assembly protein CcoS [Methylobacterium sp. 092160098-2]MDE4914664.1 cbb3-type cytochrome oxidase assembly protein CcoS [Methylobacterium sp. 092160098-2]
MSIRRPIDIAAFLWALRTGQYDDIEGAEYRPLHDD